MKPASRRIGNAMLEKRSERLCADSVDTLKKALYWFLLKASRAVRAGLN